MTKKKITKKKTSGKPKKKKNATKLQEKKLMTQQVLQALDAKPNAPQNYKQIASTLGVRNEAGRSRIQRILKEQLNRGRVDEVARGRFRMSKSFSNIEGVIQMTMSGAAFVVTSDIEEDVFISPKNLNRALNGDKVKVYLFARKRGRNPEGEVIEVVERAQSEFAGKLEVQKDYAFLVPDNHKMLVDIYIPLDKLKGGKTGQKAVAKITDWPKTASSPFGEVVTVLGDIGNNDTEMDAILANTGFPLQFPKDVLLAADRIDTTIRDEEIANRRDFRKVTTFTIDPHDAKDFDDALSIRKLRNGNWEIGIHIADVTHYVHEGSIIDKEAYKRATSVYLVDRVIPMLPEVLSNNVCSLRPKEEKYCFSAVFELTPQAELKKEWFGRTVIYSDRRFTYEEAQEIIEGAPGDFKKEIHTLNGLAKILRSERMLEGAIAFEKIEVRFKLDDRGNPTGVLIKESKDAHKLIEEFMLLANRRVATFVGKRKKGEPQKTFVYRIHDNPDLEKIREFDRFIRQFGYKLQLGSPRSMARSFNALLKDITGTPEENMIETLAIRTMQKAVYSTDHTVGHYGLAFDYYSHFTSPIRRYPDVMVHRLLQHYLNGGTSADEKQFEDRCKHSSQMERKATEAERDSTRYFQVRFLEDRIGEIFEGIVSGVSEWGIFVEIVENKCEGMVPLKTISGDYYYFDDRNYRIIGQNTGNIIALGEKVSVRVVSADLSTRRLEFELVEDWEKEL